MLAMLALVVLVAVAAITDAARHRIYNWTTYPGMLLGIGLAAGGAVLDRVAPEVAQAWQPIVGWLSLSDALGGFLLCGALMAVCFVFFPTGGGDVKLLAMVGALAGVERGLEILLWTFVWGACLGLLLLIWRVGAASLRQAAWRSLVSLVRCGMAAPVNESERKEFRSPVFLGPCAAVAVLMAFAPAMVG